MSVVCLTDIVNHVTHSNYFTVLTITSRLSLNGQLFKTISTCNNKLLIHFSYGGAFGFSS